MQPRPAYLGASTYSLILGSSLAITLYIWRYHGQELRQTPAHDLCSPARHHSRCATSHQELRLSSVLRRRFATTMTPTTTATQNTIMKTEPTGPQGPDAPSQVGPKVRGWLSVISVLIRMLLRVTHHSIIPLRGQNTARRPRFVGNRPNRVDHADAALRLRLAFPVEHPPDRVGHVLLRYGLHDELADPRLLCRLR